MKFKVIFRGNPETRGKPKIVYSREGLSFFQLERCIKAIKFAESGVENSEVIDDFCKRGTTPEEFVENGINQYIGDLKENTHRDEIEKSMLFPLIEQGAMKLLFEESKKNKVSP